MRLPFSTTLMVRPGSTGVTEKMRVCQLVAPTPETLWAEAGVARPTRATKASSGRVRRGEKGR